MKKAAGSLRVDLAQFREMEVFTQFSSDLDEDTKTQLKYGGGLMELLKQPLTHPMSLAQQVVTLVAATGKRFIDVPREKIKAYQSEMLNYFETHHEDIMSEINTQKVIDDELRESILSTVDEFRKAYNG